MEKTDSKRVISYLLKCFLVIASAVTVFLALPQSSSDAYADMGPKPSIHVTFKNMGEDICYGTLLSKRQLTGPYSAWNGEEDDKRIPDSISHDIWEAFQSYEDADGFYFLQTGWQCDNVKGIDWTYYPPKIFKILLYYPQGNTFIVSEIYETYAFNSYFTVNMSGINISDVQETEAPELVAKKSYNYALEAVFLILRIVCTILIEIAVAFIFGLGKKKLLKIIIITNIVTQILLNVALNIIRFYSGNLTFIIFYVLLEIAVFVIEAIVYGVAFKRFQAASGWKAVFYAFFANLLSFGVGFLIAMLELKNSIYIRDFFRRFIR